MIGKFEQLLNSLGQTVGIADLNHGGEGYCCLGFDDLVVHFQYTPGDDSVLIFSRLAEINTDDLQQLYGLLLSANNFWQGTGGATLGVDGDEEAVYLAQRLPISVLTPGSFEQLLNTFVSAAERWAKEVSGFVADDVTDGLLDRAKKSIADASAKGRDEVIFT